jgi:hypothetical protein
VVLGQDSWAALGRDTWLCNGLDSSSLHVRMTI